MRPDCKDRGRRELLNEPIWNLKVGAECRMMGIGCGWRKGNGDCCTNETRFGEEGIERRETIDCAHGTKKREEEAEEIKAHKRKKES